jgi:hypothetical protein
MGNVSGEGGTEYLLSVLRLRELLAQFEEHIAAGRTHGKADLMVPTDFDALMP